MNEKKISIKSRDRDASPVRKSLETANNDTIDKMYRTENIVCGFKMEGVLLNITKLVQKLDHISYNRIKFAAATARLRKPICCALIFHSGSTVNAGCKSGISALEACWRYTSMLQRQAEVPCVMSDFGIKNVVGAAECPYKIFINKLNHDAEFGKNCKYKPENFPGLIYRDKKNYNNVTFLVSLSGGVVITGSRNEELSKSSWRKFYSTVLVKFFDYKNELGDMDSSQYNQIIQSERVNLANDKDFQNLLFAKDPQKTTEYLFGIDTDTEDDAENSESLPDDAKRQKNNKILRNILMGDFDKEENEQSENEEDFDTMLLKFTL